MPGSAPYTFRPPARVQVNPAPPDESPPAAVEPSADNPYTKPTAFGSGWPIRSNVWAPARDATPTPENRAAAAHRPHLRLETRSMPRMDITGAIVPADSEGFLRQTGRLSANESLLAQESATQCANLGRWRPTYPTPPRPR